MTAMTAPRHDDDRLAPHRRRAARTAIVAGAIALAVFGARILSGATRRAAAQARRAHGHRRRRDRLRGVRGVHPFRGDRAMSGGGKFGIAKLLGVSLAAFAFTFSLVPLYRIACEKVFGIRMDNSAADASAYAAATPAERWVTVEFDSTVNSKLPWAFEPNDTRMRVRVGEQYEATFAARNRSDRPV